MTERRFSPDHVWIDPDGSIGVTSRLVSALRGLSAVHLPEVGARLTTATPFGALEGDKGVLDLFAPCDGVVRERREPVELDALARTPEEVWLVRVDGAPGTLSSRAEYEARVGRPIPRR